jgi:hypothetical protein
VNTASSASALLLAGIWLAAGAVVSAVGLLGRAGKLPRQHWAGIRLPSTMRTKEAWYAGHVAGGPMLVVAGSGGLLTGVLLLLARPSAVVMQTVSLAAGAWLVVWVLLASCAAVRAARRTSSN